MDFENTGSWREYGEKIGFIIMFVMFSLVLFGVLYFSERLPSEGGYLGVFLITLFITLFGRLIKKWLS